MKIKNIFKIFICFMIVNIILCSCGVIKKKKEEVKIGITIQSLKNVYWASVMTKLKDILDEKGYSYILVDCEDNAATQISQIENFIIGGCDMILVHPSNPDSVEFVCAEARKAGIKVMCWDEQMENTDVNWVLDNEKLGEDIGAMAADFINKHYTKENKAEVVVIGYPSTPVLLKRENGIKKGLINNCKEGIYNIIASIDGIEANAAQTNCESVLSAHPNAKVFVGIGAGAMLGANEALISKYGKKNIPIDCGVFSTDVTIEQLKLLEKDDETPRGIIGFEGSSLDTAKACVDIFDRILGGEIFDKENKNIFRSTKPITKEDVSEILKDM